MIAILLLAHSNNVDEYRYFDELGRHDGINIYCHVDSKSNFEPLDYKLNNICFVERCPVFWSGRSMVDATMKLIEKALDDERTNRLCLVSLDSRLLIEPAEFVIWCNNKVRCIQIEKYKNYTSRSMKYNFFRNSGNPKSLFARLLTRMALMVQPSRLRNSPFDGAVTGSQWWLLSREDAEHAAGYFSENEKHLDYTNCADEFFFQNSVYNKYSNVEESAIEYKFMYFDFEQRNSPKILTDRDILQARELGYVFGRKMKCS